MPAQVSKQARHRHQNTLEKDILASAPLRTTPKKRKANRGDDEGEGYVDSRASRKILKIGQELEEEDERESFQISKPNDAFAFESRYAENDDQGGDADYEDEEAWGDEGETTEEVEVNPDDLDLFNKFIPSGEQPSLELDTAPQSGEGEQGTNLTDLILQKIAAHEAKESGQPVVMGGGLPEDAIEIPAKVVEVYEKIASILSRYKSGQLPKPFKILPQLPQWEDLLSITKPESWTPNACLEATKIFVSGKKKVGRRFIETVLLDRVREDIAETGKLNVHLFNALRKCTFKPASFFQGFLFELIQSNCSLREAHVVTGVLTRASIPALHSAAALMRMTDIAAEQASTSTESGGAINVFIKALLDKQYALPYRVIDNLTFHFLRYRPQKPAAADSMDDDQRLSPKMSKLPVLWHQSLLSFARRYRNDITEDQREALLDLVLVQGHKVIGPEVRKELLAGRGRGVPISERIQDGPDNTMIMD